MTYCLGIMTREGLVMASDSRANAGFDQVNVTPKMHTFLDPGERAFVILASGNLSLTQSVITLLRNDFCAGKGLAAAGNMYEAARAVGDTVRRVSDMDRAALEKDDFNFNIHLLLGGQIKGEKPNLYLIYPQGNPLGATEQSPYLQIGEVKYGRPILDRGIEFEGTSLEVAGTYALLSLDAAMRSNVTVGPPLELLLYSKDKLEFDRYRRFEEDDPELDLMHARWEQALRRTVEELPVVHFDAHPAHALDRARDCEPF
jgi:putative proteasome-type protease